MKSFIEYLTESVEEKKYTFKIKVAGGIPEHFEDTAKAALEKYKVSSFKKGATTPIQAKLQDFPTLENVEVTIFDIELDYPTTSQVLTSYVAEHTGLKTSHIKVRSLKEDEEAELNAEHLNEKEKKALLSTDYTKENNQDLFGDKHVSAFLKELAKSNKDSKPTQIKGTNDSILAKTAHKEKSSVLPKVAGSSSILSGQKGNPDPRKGK